MKSVAFNTSADASLPVLASAGDFTVLLSDPRPTQKAELLSVAPHSPGNEVEAVGISPDGSLLVSGGRDGYLVFMTLSVPSLLPRSNNDSISARLRKSRVILDQSERYNSTENLAESTSQLSVSEGDILAAVQNEHLRPPPPGIHLQPKREFTARESRKKRAEKKVVDLPTMIAHLSFSFRGSVLEEQPSSSDSEEDTISELQQRQDKIGDIVDMTQKVNKYSQLAKKMSVDEMLHKPPEPRLSLLPGNVEERVRHRRKLFERRRSHDYTDGYDGKYSNMREDDELQNEQGAESQNSLKDDSTAEESESLHESGNYSLNNSFRTEATVSTKKGSSKFSVLASSFTEESGSGEEYYDEEEDITLSMI